MKILNKEVDFDLEEAENLDKLLLIDTQYEEEIKKATNITEQCKFYKKFFVELLGEKIVKELFGEKNKIFDLIEAYNDIVLESEKVSKKINEKQLELNKKYERYK